MSLEHHDPDGDRFGMWVFLFSEILLFGGMFVLYAAYLMKFTEGFVNAGARLNMALGATNTIVLLVSSWAVAASITAIRKENKKMAISLLGFALFCMFTFLTIKYFEWGAKIHHGIYPSGPALDDMPHGEVIFYGLYYTVTGLHGLHVIIGGILLGLSTFFIVKGKVTADKYVFLENSGLYWHLVDLIWIFVFPLFYLVV
jgi:cytochrome c oxidase subunit 3